MTMSIRNKLLQDILSAIGGGGAVLWGSITGNIVDQTDLATVAKTNDYDDLINKFDPTTDISMERLIDGVSVAVSQNPTGLGIANATRVEFGPAVNTGSDPANLLANGELQINVAGTYRIKLAMQFGRTGSSQTSILLFRVTDDAGNQLGRSIAALIDDADTDRYLENDTWLTVPGPINLRFEIMRDNAGNNSGGLISTVPTDEGVGTWNDAPSAALRVERWT
jgi:hypothetical protein